MDGEGGETLRDLSLCLLKTVEERCRTREGRSTLFLYVFFISKGLTKIRPNKEKPTFVNRFTRRIPIILLIYVVRRITSKFIFTKSSQVQGPDVKSMALTRKLDI